MGCHVSFHVLHRLESLSTNSALMSFPLAVVDFQVIFEILHSLEFLFAAIKSTWKLWRSVCEPMTDKIELLCK